jgi:hypothetical protein
MFEQMNKIMNIHLTTLIYGQAFRWPHNLQKLLLYNGTNDSILCTYILMNFTHLIFINIH